MRGIHQEDGLDLTLQGALHHPHGITGILGIHGPRQVLFRHPPGERHFGTMGVIIEGHVERQSAGQSPGEALTHGIGLAGHGKRAASRFRQVTGQGQQVDDGDDVMLSVNMLVITDAPHNDDTAVTLARVLALAALQAFARGLGEHARDAPDQGRRDFLRSHAILYLFRAVFFQHGLGVFLPAGGVFLDKLPIDDIIMVLE